jgi:hypothetical protein
VFFSGSLLVVNLVMSDRPSFVTTRRTRAVIASIENTFDSTEEDFEDISYSHKKIPIVDIIDESEKDGVVISQEPIAQSVLTSSYGE